MRFTFSFFASPVPRAEPSPGHTFSSSAAFLSLAHTQTQNLVNTIHLLPALSTRKRDPATPSAENYQPWPAHNPRVARAHGHDRGAPTRIIKKHRLQVLHSRIARGVYASRDPVPHHVHRTRPRPDNPPHLHAVTYWCRGSPGMLAYSAHPPNQCRRQVRVCFASPGANLTLTTYNFR